MFSRSLFLAVQFFSGFKFVFLNFNFVLRRLECQNVKVSFAIFHSNSPLVNLFQHLSIQFLRISIKFGRPTWTLFCCILILQFDFVFVQPICNNVHSNSSLDNDNAVWHFWIKLRRKWRQTDKVAVAVMWVFRDCDRPTNLNLIDDNVKYHSNDWTLCKTYWPKTKFKWASAHFQASRDEKCKCTTTLNDKIWIWTGNLQ